MYSTLSQIFSAAYIGLGLTEPGQDWVLPRLQLANIAYRRLSIRLEGVRQSENAISIAKTVEFQLGGTSNEQNLTSLANDFVVPMWVERQELNILNNPIWAFVPTINLNMLQQRRQLGLPAVSFYGGTAAEVIAQFSYYGNEAQSTFMNHRVWYLPTVPMPDNEQQPLDIPDNLTNIVVLDVMCSAIPQMIVAASGRLKDMPELAEQMKAWDMLLMSLKGEQQEMQVLWDKWMKESRGSHRPRRRGDIMRNRRMMGNNGFYVNN